MNILILTAKYGMGHYTASLSLKQELENENTKVEVIDFLDIIFPKIKPIIYQVFNFLVSRCSSIYNFFYKFSANTEFVFFKKRCQKRMEKILKEKKIDIVISTFPICSKYISAYKKVADNHLKLYTYITDIDVNKEWLTDENDMYFVASNETKKQVMDYQVPEEKIKVVGIPVKKEFKIQKFEKNKNEILMMGGGLGLISGMEKTLENLAQNPEIHITLLAGKNQKLLEKYQNRYHNVTVIGYTNEVYRYMKKAKLMITKAGGITLFEAVHSQTPMVVLNPFLSQEIGNAKFIQKHKIGKVIWNKNEPVAEEILELLKNPKELENMRKNMQTIKNELETLSVVDVYEKGA